MEPPQHGRTGAILSGMGVKPGVADLALVLPGGRPGFLELKSRKGRLSPRRGSSTKPP